VGRIVTEDEVANAVLDVNAGHLFTP